MMWFLSCRGAEVGLDDSCDSLPTQQILWFYRVILNLIVTINFRLNSSQQSTLEIQFAMWLVHNVVYSAGGIQVTSQFKRDLYLMISFLRLLHKTLYISRVYSKENIMIPKWICLHTIIPATLDYIWAEKEVFSVCVLLFYINWYLPEHFSRPQSLGPYFDRKKSTGKLKMFH